MLKCLGVWTHLCVCPGQFICGKTVFNTLCSARSLPLVSRTHNQKHSQPPCSSLQRGPFKSPHMLLSKHVTLFRHKRAAAHAQAKHVSTCAFIMYVQEEHAHQSAQRPISCGFFFLIKWHQLDMETEGDEPGLQTASEQWEVSCWGQFPAADNSVGINMQVLLKGIGNNEVCVHLFLYKSQRE